MEKIYEATVYRQQTVVPERKETNKVSPTIAQAHTALPEFQVMA